MMRLLRKQPGFPLSAGAHITALVLSVVAFSSPKPFNEIQVESLPVEILSPKEFDALTRGSKTAKEVKEQKPQAEKLASEEIPKPEDAPIAKQEAQTPTRTAEPTPRPTPPKEEVAEAEEPEPKPIPKPEPKKVAEAPTPKPEQKPEPKKAEEKPEPKKAEEKPTPKPEAKKPEPKKAETKPEAKPEPKQTAKAQEQAKPFDANRIAALLDKRDPSRTQATGREINKTASLGTATGTAPKLSLSQRSAIDGAIRDQLSACWNPPYAANADALKVRVRFTLKQDGTLAANPELIGSSSDGLYRAAAESALRAVRRCSPLKLPAEHYAYWQNVEVNFDPREMFGG